MAGCAVSGLSLAWHLTVGSVGGVVLTFGFGVVGEKVRVEDGWDCGRDGHDGVPAASLDIGVEGSGAEVVSDAGLEQLGRGQGVFDLSCWSEETVEGAVGKQAEST